MARDYEQSNNEFNELLSLVKGKQSGTFTDYLSLIDLFNKVSNLYKTACKCPGKIKNVITGHNNLTKEINFQFTFTGSDLKFLDDHLRDVVDLDIYNGSIKRDPYDVVSSPSYQLNRVTIFFG